jgi:hypothetical protein
MGLAHSPRIVTDGLVLCLDAANPKSYPGSGNTWSDLSGNGNNGTLVNGVGYNSGNNGSMVLDGVDDVIIINSIADLQGNDPWTLDMWVNVDSSEIGSGRRGWLFWQGAGNQTLNQLLSVGVNNSAIEVAHWANDTVFQNATIDFDSWSCFTITFNGTTELVYKNSISVGNKNTTLSLVTGTIYLASRGNVEFLNAKYGILKIYNRALSDSEIQQNFNALRGRYGL